MLNELKKEANYTTTENGALTYGSTMSDCLDLFSTIGGMRHSSEEEIVKRFSRAYVENPNIAMKILFFARDIRKGLGERRIFRIIIKYLAEKHMDSMNKNIEYVAEYGRYDDLLELLGTPCEAKAIECMKERLFSDIKVLEEDGSHVSLLGKWLPSVNTSNKEKVLMGRKLAKEFGMSEREYRKVLSALRREIKILENYLRKKDYTFDYSKQPSKAMFKYREAFYRNDGERFNLFLDQVKCGKTKINTETLAPYEIIRPLCNDYYDYAIDENEKEVINTLWNNMERIESDDNTLAVVDTSGSMYWDVNPQPIAVALSLGVYFAEQNTGEFSNHVLTFSHNPRFIELKGKNVVEKVEFLKSFCEMADTNIQKTFELVLNTAIKYHLPKEEMPKRLVIISDMEFNYCTRDAGLTNFDYAKKIYEKAGYELPKLVFWNVASRKLQVPVRMNEQGVTLVSGCSPKIFEQVLSNETDPYSFMLEVVKSKRYEKIVA